MWGSDAWRTWDGAMQQTLVMEGEVVDQQTFLDGTREFTIEAASVGPADAGGWLLTLSFRWLTEIDASVEEGDLSLTDAEGSGVYAAVTEGSAETAFDDEIADEVTLLRLRADVRSGEGGFAGWSGAVQVSGRLAGGEVRLEAALDLTPP
jgi:hypothetical protein